VVTIDLTMSSDEDEAPHPNAAAGDEAAFLDVESDSEDDGQPPAGMATDVDGAAHATGRAAPCVSPPRSRSLPPVRSVVSSSCDTQSCPPPVPQWQPSRGEEGPSAALGRHIVQ